MKRGLAVLLMVIMVGFSVVACDRNPSPVTPTAVVAAPVISQFSVDSTNPRLLVWTVQIEAPSTIRISPVVGNVQAVGQQLVTPDTYTIVATNAGGTVQRSYEVK